LAEQGLTRKEIAEEIGFARGTVGIYAKNEGIEIDSEDRS